MIFSVNFADGGREEELKALLRERILVLDGAMGTMIQSKNPTAEDFGGPQYEGANEHLILTRPDMIRDIHAAYLAAGADIIETNTFGALRHVLAEYGLSDKTAEINRRAALIAKAEALRFSTKEKPRFVAGSLGPGTRTISVTGGITFDEVRRAYAEAAEGLLDGGADLLLLETQQDALNIKASLLGFADCFEKLGRSVAVMTSVSVEAMGTMLGGSTIEAAADALSGAGLLGLGLNCATGPDFMTDHLRTLSETSEAFTVCYPNAGLPDETGRYHETPDKMARALERFMSEGWINVVGGCCGTTDEHIRAVAAAAGRYAPRRPARRGPRRAVSGLESLELSEDKRPILVGERTNVIGSRRFRELIAKGDYEAASEIGRAQVRAGAHILDVCLADPDRDERRDMVLFLETLARKIKAPLMIDTTDPEVLEEALKRTPGRSVVNSVNLEDGEERLKAVAPILKRYGAAVVAGTIDENKTAGMALTRERKLEIARRMLGLLTGSYGLSAADVIFDPLVFPAATGDKNYWGSAVETIEGIRLIKKHIPGSRTILGISNVSFGLPPAGREVLNSVFLHLCVEAGLDMAIVNSERIAPYSRIPENEKSLAIDLLKWKGPGTPAAREGPNPLDAFVSHFRSLAPQAKAPSERLKLPVPERIRRSVIEGSRDGLSEDLAELLKTRAPLEIVNGPLMSGMDEVGRLFAQNQMIVAEVLGSAEVMKAAVSYLEPHMDKSAGASRGRVLLATVKGDVHDIGKNLVHIILKNNGYEIEDLGIKVAPEALIEAARNFKPDMIGLSGLLVKSAQQMTVTADDLESAGLSLPLLVGGAALSAKFTATKIAPRYDGPVLYAKDAMIGLDIANSLQDPKRRAGVLLKNKEIQQMLSTDIPAPAPSAPPSGPAFVPSRDHEAPLPPDLKIHVVENISLEDIFAYINPVMLYGRHLGFKGNWESLLKAGDPKALSLKRRVSDLQEEVIARRLLAPKAVYRFFAAGAEGNSVSLYETPADPKPVETFKFPRQARGEGLCLADFVKPAKDGRGDFLALFVVTCGAGVLETSRELREKGEYLKSHALQSLAIESAEAFAELLHDRLRRMWGFPDPKELTIKEKFQARYRGIRVSFGYPACPEMEDQAKIFRLLGPEKRIGVSLTEGFMMDPEASVSAVVFHHPQARYFSVA